MGDKRYSALPIGDEHDLARRVVNVDDDDFVDQGRTMRFWRPLRPRLVYLSSRPWAPRGLRGWYFAALVLIVAYGSRLLTRWQSKFAPLTQRLNTKRAQPLRIADPRHFAKWRVVTHQETFVMRPQRTASLIGR
jgi:hypothetical protein